MVRFCRSTVAVVQHRTLTASKTHNTFTAPHCGTVTVVDPCRALDARVRYLRRVAKMQSWGPTFCSAA